MLKRGQTGSRLDNSLQTTDRRSGQLPLRLCQALVVILWLSGTIGWSDKAVADEFPRVIDVEGPRRDDRFICNVVTSLIERQHLTKQKFDEEISRRAFRTFLRNLDPNKNYFRAADVAEFEPMQDRIGDMVRGGDVSMAYQVYKRLLDRVQQDAPVIAQLIDQEHDFDVDESIVIDRKLLEYPENDAQAHDRWRRQIKYEMLVELAEDKPIEEIREKLHRRARTRTKRLMQTDVCELLEIFLTAVTTSLDPHTTYMAPRQQKNFDIIMSLKLEGIGAQLTPDDGYTKIASIVPGGAADKEGTLKEGDRIVAVAQGRDDQYVDVVDMKLDDVVSLIRGAEGTTVRLRYEPALGGDTREVSIVRAKIQLEDSAARGKVIEHGQRADGSPFRIGYINLPSFYMDMEGASRNTPDYRSTTRDMRKLITEFKASGVDAVVLDLSRNGGGSLTESINATGLFIESGPVVQVKDPNQRVVPYRDDSRQIAWDGPLVVVTSKMSASASEIFAGAIRDYGRGIVVGDPTTHGKGTVQTLIDIGDTLFGAGSNKQYGALKMTIQQFYLPDGKSTQVEGVPSDIVLPAITAHIDNAESDLDYALPYDKVPDQKHIAYGMVDPGVLNRLRVASAERISQDSDFDKLLARIELYRQQKDEKSISLRKSDFLARRALLRAEEEEAEELMEEDRAVRDRIFNDNYYNREVLNITIDYVEALGERKLAKAG
jgi:carboxyl-terminal processing protease